MTKLTNHEIENMDFDTVVDNVENLLSVRTSDYANESMKFVVIFSTLSRFNRVHVKKLMWLTQQRDKLFVKLQKHYSGKMSPDHYKANPLPVIPKDKDIDRWVRADELMMEMEVLVRDQEQVVKVIEEGIKQSNTRNYAIKNALDYQRLIQEGR